MKDFAQVILDRVDVHSVLSALPAGRNQFRCSVIYMNRIDNVQVFEFTTGARTVNKVDLLDCLIHDCRYALEPFKDFCEIGTGSYREDWKTYQGCRENEKKMRKLFGPDYKALFAPHFRISDDIPF